MNRCFALGLALLLLVGCRGGASDTPVQHAPAVYATVEEAEAHAQLLRAKSYRAKYQICLDRAAEWRRRAAESDGSYAERCLNKADRYEIKSVRYLKAAADCEKCAAEAKKRKQGYREGRGAMKAEKLREQGGCDTRAEKTPHP